MQGAGEDGVCANHQQQEDEHRFHEPKPDFPIREMIVPSPPVAAGERAETGMAASAR